MFGMVRAVQDALAAAVDIARAAGRALAAGFAGGPAAILGMRHGAASKSAEFDLVTEYDKRSEALLVERLARAFPRDAVIAEEGSAVSGAGAVWYVDPLDGTTNFAHGLPMFCVALGRVVDGRPDLGVVHAPILDLTFTATRGGGAWCNDRRLHVSTVSSLDRAMLATGFPSDRVVTGDTNFPQFVAIKSKARAVRRLGSSALDQALVAAGTYDGFWEMKLKAWDLAAGSLLVEEAGGRATGWLGEPLRLEHGAVVVSNGALHDEILALLAGAGIPSVVR
jgi:myo-inositol-1(or 4)-monophosphatase